MHTFQPIERSVSSEPTTKEKAVLNACPKATLSQVRKMLITHKQDVDEAIEALYESEYQNDPVVEDGSTSPSKLDESTATPDEVVSSPEKALSGTPDLGNEHDVQSQESGTDEKRKRKRLTARDRKMQAKMKQKQQRKAKKKPVEEEQQEAKVTSELRQLYI
jgi:hypothetical protein